MTTELQLHCVAGNVADILAMWQQGKAALEPV